MYTVYKICFFQYMITALVVVLYTDNNERGPATRRMYVLTAYFGMYM